MSNVYFAIRSMKREDIPAVVQIEQQVQYHPWGEQSFEECIVPGFAAWVIEIDSVIVGFAILSTAVAEVELLNIAIAPIAQQQGLGFKLLKSVIAQLGDSAENLFLEVRESNRPAVALYKKIGFEQVGLRKNYYPTVAGREAALLFKLQL